MSGMHNERRRSFRIPVTGRASLQHAGRLDGLYQIENLSIGGCSLMNGPLCTPGEHVEVALHLTNQGKLLLPATVVRSEHEARGESVGLAFRLTPPTFEDRLQDLVMRSIEREQRGEILVVHAQPERLLGLINTIRGLGQRIVSARTPRDAVSLLESAAEHIRIAIVAPIVGTSSARDIVKLILRRFPHVQCVMLSRGTSERLVRAIRSEMPREPSPWSLSRLRQVIARTEIVVKTTVS